MLSSLCFIHGASQLLENTSYYDHVMTQLEVRTCIVELSQERHAHILKYFLNFTLSPQMILIFACANYHLQLKSKYFALLANLIAT